MTRILKDKTGGSSVFTAVMVLAVSLILGVTLFFASVEIQAIQIKNAVKTELANLSIRISGDTYKSLRESNFEEYLDTLTRSSSYKRALTERFKANLAETIEFSNESYKI